MKSKAKLGLKQLMREASSKLDPAQKQLADRLADDLVHAIAVKDAKSAGKVVGALARLFLRESVSSPDQ